MDPAFPSLSELCKIFIITRYPLPSITILDCTVFTMLVAMAGPPDGERGPTGLAQLKTGERTDRSTWSYFLL